VNHAALTVKTKTSIQPNNQQINDLDYKKDGETKILEDPKYKMDGKFRFFLWDWDLNSGL
jgi:hypothetical protein